MCKCQLTSSIHAVSALVCLCASAEPLLNHRAPRGLLQVCSPSSQSTAAAPVSEQLQGEGTGTVTSLCRCSLGHLHAEAGHCWDPRWHMLERNPASPGGREPWLHGSLHFLFIRKPHFFSQPHPGPAGLRYCAGIVSRYCVTPSFPDRSLFLTTLEKHWCEFSFLFASQDKNPLN